MKTVFRWTQLLWWKRRGGVLLGFCSTRVFLVTLAHYDWDERGNSKRTPVEPSWFNPCGPQHLWEVFLSHLRCDHLALAPEPHMSDNPCSATKADAGIFKQEAPQLRADADCLWFPAAVGGDVTNSSRVFPQEKHQGWQSVVQGGEDERRAGEPQVIVPHSCWNPDDLMGMLWSQQPVRF